MEHLVLKVLEFDLSVPTAHLFVNKMCQMIPTEDKVGWQSWHAELCDEPGCDAGEEPGPLPLRDVPGGRRELPALPAIAGPHPSFPCAIFCSTFVLKHSFILFLGDGRSSIG